MAHRLVGGCAHLAFVQRGETALGCLPGRWHGGHLLWRSRLYSHRASMGVLFGAHFLLRGRIHPCGSGSFRRKSPRLTRVFLSNLSLSVWEPKTAALRFTKGSAPLT